MKLRAIATVALFALAIASAFASSETNAVTDESIRQAALHAVFPGMQISLLPGKRINAAWPTSSPEPGQLFYPDALANEAVYLVSGPAANQIEMCASENLLTDKFSKEREVRLKVFRCPGKVRTDLLVLAQYGFVGANSAGSCWSVGLLVRLTRKGGAWHRSGAYLLDPQHHNSIQRVELIDLKGTGNPDLVVESNFGGAETAGSTLQIFGLTGGRFDEVLRTNSRLESGTEEIYEQKLDLAGTRAEKGKRFPVIKTSYIGNGAWLTKPILTREVYERGFGVDSRDVRFSREGWAAERIRRPAGF